MYENFLNVGTRSLCALNDADQMALQKNQPKKAQANDSDLRIGLMFIKIQINEIILANK